MKFGDEISVSLYQAEDDYPNIRLNKRTAKYLLDYPELDQLCPDMNNELYNSDTGIYHKACGFDCTLRRLRVIPIVQCTIRDNSMA